MKPLNNQQGIALITALMFTLISFVIIMGLFYVLTMGVRVSSSQKSYKTAREASYGGSEVVLKDIIPLVLQSLTESEIRNQFTYGSIGVDLQLQLPSFSSGCISEKLHKPTNQWSSSCSNSLSPKDASDFVFTLKASTTAHTTNAAPYRVYAKIVDTILGNSDVSGLQLEGSGVSEASNVIVPQHFPFVYRLEVQAQRDIANPLERANVSVLYAY